MKPQRRVKRASRQGLSMLEVLTAMTIGAFIFSIVIGWIHLTLKSASQTRSLQNQNRRLVLLEHRLRKEIRAADTIQMNAEQELNITRDDQSIFYEISVDGHSLTRRNAADSDQSRFEVCRLNSGSEFRWTTDDMPQRIQLTVHRRLPLDLKAPLATTRPGPIEFILRTGPAGLDVDRVLPKSAGVNDE